MNINHKLRSKKMNIEDNTRVNIYGGSKKYNYDCTVKQSTEKAIQFESSEADHLHDFNVSFWVAKSVLNKSEIAYNYGTMEIILPFWVDLRINKIQLF